MIISIHLVMAAMPIDIGSYSSSWTITKHTWCLQVMLPDALKKKVVGAALLMP